MDFTTVSFQFLDLPEHIQVKTFTHCDFKTLLQASQTSKKFEELIFAACDLNQRIVLHIFPKLNGNDISDTIKSGRIYTQVKVGLDRSFLFEEDYIAMDILAWEASLVDHFKINGSWIKELTFNEVRGREVTMSQLLSYCPNVETISISIFDNEISPSRTQWNNQDVKLTKLKELNLSGFIMQFSDTFSKIKSLQRLKLDLAGYVGDLLPLEDFIIQQDNLKHLTIEVIRPTPFFQRHHLNDIKFQLESFSTDNLTIDPSSATKFFARQKSLKQVKLRYFYHRGIFNQRAEYSEIISSVLSLPKLKSLNLGVETIDIEDFTFMTDFKNSSVTRLRFNGDKNVYSKFISMFPNLTDVRIQNEMILLDVDLISADNLHIVDADRVLQLKFQPEAPPSDQAKLEDQLLEFFSRHRCIEKLVIGHQAWKARNFRFSLRFWVKACELLQRLEKIVIFDLPEIQEFIRIVRGHENLKYIALRADVDSAKVYYTMKAYDDFKNLCIRY